MVYCDFPPLVRLYLLSQADLFPRTHPEPTLNELREGFYQLMADAIERKFPELYGDGNDHLLAVSRSISFRSSWLNESQCVRVFYQRRWVGTGVV
jgi:hypothetical protein